MQTLHEYDEDEIAELLIGRRVVEAEAGDFRRPDDNRWAGAVTGRLRLDDGTVVLVAPNEGSCTCSAGDYYLESIAKVDNIITSVKLVNDPDGDDARTYNYDTDEYEGPKPEGYKIFVYCDNTEINLMHIDGSDGNGYYGTGYELIVLPASGVAS